MAYTGGNTGYVRRLGKIPASTPTSPVGGYAAWFDAAVKAYSAYPTLATTDGEVVTEWEKASGTYSPLTCTRENGAGTECLLRLDGNGINGKPVIESPSILCNLRDFYATSTIFEGGIHTVSAGTIMFVAKATVDANYRFAFGDVNSRIGYALSTSYTGNQGGTAFINDGSDKFATKEATISGTAAVFTFHHEGGVLYSGVNDCRTASMASVACGNLVATVDNLRLLGSGSSTFLGKLGEILFYKTALSEADRKLNERYLANKYGITLPY